MFLILRLKEKHTYSAPRTHTHTYFISPSKWYQISKSILGYAFSICSHPRRNPAGRALPFLLSAAICNHARCSSVQTSPAFQESAQSRVNRIIPNLPLLSRRCLHKCCVFARRALFCVYSLPTRIHWKVLQLVCMQREACAVLSTHRETLARIGFSSPHKTRRTNNSFTHLLGREAKTNHPWPYFAKALFPPERLSVMGGKVL